MRPIGIGAIVIVTAVVGFVLHRRLSRQAERPTPGGDATEDSMQRELPRAARAPVQLLALFYGARGAARFAGTSGKQPEDWVEPAGTFLRALVPAGLEVAALWFAYRAGCAIETSLQRMAARTERRLDDVVLGLLGAALRLAVPVLGLILLLRLVPLPSGLAAFTAKLTPIEVIHAIAWLARRAILLTDQAVIGATEPASIDQRALVTRVRVLRRLRWCS